MISHMKRKDLIEAALPKRSAEEIRAMSLAYAYGSGPEPFDYRRYIASEDWLARRESLMPDDREHCALCHCRNLSLTLSPKHPLLMGKERKCDVHLLCPWCYTKWLHTPSYKAPKPRKHKIGRFDPSGPKIGKGTYGA